MTPASLTYSSQAAPPRIGSYSPEEIAGLVEYQRANEAAKDVVRQNLAAGRKLGHIALKEKADENHAYWLKEAKRIYSEAPGFVAVKAIAVRVAYSCTVNNIRPAKKRSYSWTTIRDFLLKHREEIYATPKRASQARAY